ncbi:MAG: response regulator [Chloroflexi bacterium]|nr:response regulator [Chloroflexota bacterium]
MIKSEDLMQQLLQTFRAEAAEHLQNLNMAILALELRPEDTKRRELVQEAFRSAHSLKGAARTVGLEAIEQLANAMESALQKARTTETHLEEKICEALYDALDNIGFLLEGKTVAVEALVSRLSTGDEDKANPTTPVQAAPPPGAPIPEVPKPSSPSRIDTSPTPVPAETTPHDDSANKTAMTSGEESIRVSISKLDDLMAQVGELVVSRINAEQRIAEFRDIRQQVAHSSKVWREIKTLLPTLDVDAAHQLTEILFRYEKQFEATLQNINRFDQRLKQDTVRLGVITSQLQDNARHVRMLPFETLVPTLQRTIRDAAHSENKQVIFNVVGGSVELDKKVLEALKDPFIHMLRNAVGHGIESAEVRQSRGKPVEGHVRLTLQQRGSEVRISIADDGGGFDLKGLHDAGSKSSGQVINEHDNDHAIIELAFLPGITTKKEITTLSGRGVGLDVVRERIEELQGHIEVESIPGEGAAIHLVVPSSLTISRGLLIQVENERYVLPLLSVLKILQPHETFTVGGQSMITIDGVTMPIMPLASLLGRTFNLEKHHHPLVVIMAVAEQRLALLVDDVLTEQELAIKPLGTPLRRVHNIAGAALMGDGQPVVVLNAADLVRAAKGGHKQVFSLKQNEIEAEKPATRILVVDDSITTRTLEKSILETAGYEVITATDGLQALQKLQEQQIELVVSDVEMPNMDGITLTKELRANSAFEFLPVILVTSLESEADRERGMMAGANAYIVKRGFDQGELLKTITELVFTEDD